jgi:hypothetical protein
LHFSLQLLSFVNQHRLFLFHKESSDQGPDSGAGQSNYRQNPRKFITIAATLIGCRGDANAPGSYRGPNCRSDQDGFAGRSFSHAKYSLYFVSFYGGSVVVAPKCDHAIGGAFERSF